MLTVGKILCAMSVIYDEFEELAMTTDLTLTKSATVIQHSCMQ